MVKVPSTPITSSELVSGVIGTIDVSGLISEILAMDTDLKLSQPFYKYLFDSIDTGISNGQTNLLKLLTKDGSIAFKFAVSALPTTLKYILQQTNNALVQSASGAKITSTLFGQDAKFYSQFHFASLLTNLVFDLPSEMVRSEVSKYLNKTYALEPLSEPMFLLANKNSKKTDSEYITMLQEELGISKDDATTQLSFRQNQLGVPSLRDTFSMIRKDLLTDEDWDRIAHLGLGFTKDMGNALYNSFFYDFAPNEIMRLSDFASLDSDWIDEKLRYAGILEADRAIFKQAIERRPLRDEISREYSIILDNYQWGLQSETDFRAKLATWKFSQVEIDARVETGNLLEEKLRLKLLRDAEVYLYRKDVTDEEGFLLRLKDLNIGFDIANALVRNEAAKKGIDWEISPSP